MLELLSKTISKKIFVAAAAAILVGGFFVLKMALAVSVFNVIADSPAVDIGQTKNIAFTLTAAEGSPALKTIAVSAQGNGFSEPTGFSCPTGWSQIPAMPPILNGYVCDDPTETGLQTATITLNGLTAPLTAGARNFSVSAINFSEQSENKSVSVLVKNLSANIGINPTTTNTNQQRNYTLSITNNGDDAITQVSGALTEFTINNCAASGWDCARAGSSYSLSNNSLAPSASIELSVTATAPGDYGDRALTAAITGSLGGERTAAITPSVIEVQFPASLITSAISTDRNFISNASGAHNTATISILITNIGQSTAINFETVLTIKNSGGDDISGQFLISPELSGTSELASGASSTLSWTVTALGAAAAGIDQAEITVEYGDSNDPTLLDLKIERDNNSIFTVDNTAPTLPTVAIASNNANATLAKTGDIITLTFTANESIQTPTVTISEQTANVAGSNQNWTAIYTMAESDTEGAIPFAINFADLANNAGAQTVIVTDASSVTFDKTPPVITVAPYNGTTPTNQDITVNASATGGTLNTVSHIFTANGSFDFIATDEAGNVTTQTVTITNIDKQAPSIVSYSFNGIEQNLLVNPEENDVQIHLDSSENVNWLYIRIVNISNPSILKTFGSGAGCVDGTSSCGKIWEDGEMSFGTLVDGDYRLKVHIKDAANNETETNLSPYLITVDTTDPVINPHDNVIKNVTTQTGATVDYDLPSFTDADSNTVVSCLPASGALFEYGDTKVECSAIDTAGNEADETEFTVTVIDNAAPEITISGFTADDNVMPGDLTDGYVLNTENSSTNHNLQLNAGSVANEELKNEYRELIITGLSEEKKTELKNYYTNMGYPEPYLSYLKDAVDGLKPFAYLKTEKNSLTLLDGAKHNYQPADETDMTIPDNYPLGEYTVTGSVRDLEGNATTQTFKLIVAGSLVVPTATVAYSPSSWTNDSVVATITPSEPLLSGETSHTFTENGSHTFNFISQRRTAGSVVATVDFIDKIAPTVDAGVGGLYNSAFTQTATAADLGGSNNLTYEWEQISGPDDAVIFSDDEINPVLISASTDGIYEIELTVTDQAGNSASDTMIFTWDATAPAAPVIASIAGDEKINISEKSAVHVIGTAEADSLVSVTLSDGAITTAPVNGTATGGNFDIIVDATTLSDGTVTPNVTATDAAGNTSAPALTPIALKDTIAPQIAVDEGTSVSPVKTDAINLTVAETNPNISEYGFSLNNICDGTDTYGESFASGVEFSIAGNHKDYLCAKAVDSVNNETYLLVGQLNTDNTATVISLSSLFTDQTLTGGHVYPINWTASDLNFSAAPIKIEYSINNGSDWLNVINATDNDGVHAWSVPTFINSSSAKIKITALDLAGNQSDAQSSAFTIAYSEIIDTTAPQVLLNSQNSGGSFQAGSIQVITWTATDNTTPANSIGIKLEYSVDGSATWEAITLSTENDGAYLWTVPNEVSPNCLVRVTASDAVNNSGSDISNSVFGITAAPLHICSDAGSGKWTCDIVLSAGWNLMSLPVIISETTIADVLSAISGNVQIVQYYKDEEWDSYVPGEGGDLENMVDGKGYWIYMNSPATLTVTGRKAPLAPALPKTYSVESGWNLIGFKSTITQPTSNYLQSLPVGGYTLLNAGSENKTSGFMDAGQGYWLWMNDDGSIATYSENE